MRSFDLIVCIDFLLKLTMFLSIPSEQENTVATHKISIDSSVRETAVRPSTLPAINTNQVPTKTESKIHLILHIEKPDIILVESLDDLNTNAIVFNVSCNTPI